MEDKYIVGLVNGDRGVVEEIYDTYLNNVVKWLINNSGSQADALDVFQEALSQILVSARKNKITLNSTFGAYLTATCKYIWLGRLKKEKRIEKVRLEDASSLTSEETDTAGLQEKEYLLHQFLESNKMKLSETCIKLLALVAQKVKIGEIASQLNMSSPNTVYRRKFACLKKWREHIESDTLYHQWKELQYEY